MIKLLPFEINPQIRTYLNYAYSFGVIEGNLGSGIIPRLICDSYVGCIYSYEDVNMFYIYNSNGDSWFENNGIMSHNSHVCKKCDIECISEAIEITKEKISSGEYVYCYPNEGYFTIINNGKPYNFDHECLLWGIDYDKRTFQSSSYIRGNYAPYEIGFDELYNALLNVQSGYVELLFFKLNSNFVFKPLKIDKVIFLLNEYMSSKCSDFNNRTDIKKYIDSGKLKFGIAVWKELINYLEKIGQSGEVIDMRYIRSFMDYKKLMKLRVEYLVNNNYLNKSYEYLSKIEHNYITTQNLMLMLLKYKYKPEDQLLRRAIEKIKIVNEMEQTYIPKLIDGLSTL